MLQNGTETVWSALEKLARGEVLEPSTIEHEANPLVVLLRNCNGYVQKIDGFTNGIVALRLHRHDPSTERGFVHLSVRAPGVFYSLAVPWLSQNCHGSGYAGCASVRERVNRLDYRELTLEVADIERMNVSIWLP